jgi:ribosomal protein S18 acetylase RimI-like enzyme
MDTWRERFGPPWYGVDGGLLRRLEIHETRVDALGPGRELVDLGDALAVFDPVDPDPFFNRLAAIRWPDDPDAFAARLDAAIRQFVARDRQPYVWLAPGFLQPEDIADRLRARGFTDLEGGLVMILVRDPRALPPRSLPVGTVIERIGRDAPDGGASAARAAARLIGEAFAVSGDRVDGLTKEILSGLDDPRIDVRLARIDGDPVAVGRRHGHDGMSYLSAIGVRRDRQGLSLGEAVTRALIDGALETGDDPVYLGVYASNLRALALYRRLGFEILGGPSPDLILL